MTASTASGSAAPTVEVHSIDYIPQKERHGKVTDQFTLWFLGNANLATLAVGLIAMTLGLPLIWVLVAIILGEFFGTFFMAFHSVQGPRMGIPQLLQSRPQFGYFGALIPQAIGLFLYVGFTCSTHHRRGALSAVTGIGERSHPDHGRRSPGPDDRWLRLDPLHPEVGHVPVPDRVRDLPVGVLLTATPPGAGEWDFAWTPFLVVIVIVASTGLAGAVRLRLQPLPAEVVNGPLHLPVELLRFDRGLVLDDRAWRVPAGELPG